VSDEVIQALVPLGVALVAGAVIVIVFVVYRRRRGNLDVRAGGTRASFKSAQPRSDAGRAITTEESTVSGNDFRMVRGAKVGIFASIFKRNRVDIYEPGSGKPPTGPDR
jgi:hypothetical protein